MGSRMGLSDILFSRLWWLEVRGVGGDFKVWWRFRWYGVEVGEGFEVFCETRGVRNGKT